MKNIHEHFHDYKKTHSHNKNKNIQFICAPVILFSIIGMLYDCKLLSIHGFELNAGVLVVLLFTMFYFSLSRTLWVGMLLFGLASLTICELFERYINFQLWQVCLVLFMCAWATKYAGNQFERKRAPIAKDPYFLLIGLAYIISSVYEKLRISY